MTQVWSSSMVHFLFQDPLKAIICKIFNKKGMHFFFQIILQRGKQDSLIQFYVKSNLFLICGLLSSVIVIEAGGLGQNEWHLFMVVVLFHSMKWQSGFPSGERSKSQTLVRMTGLWSWTHSAQDYLLCLVFSFTVWSPEYEQSSLTRFTYFASSAYWPSLLYEKWNSNVQRQCQKDGMEMSQLVTNQVCELQFYSS